MASPPPNSMPRGLLVVLGLGAAGWYYGPGAYRRLTQRQPTQVIPEARLDGVLVAPMVRGGVELIAGVSRDPVFGPVVMVGKGGWS